MKLARPLMVDHPDSLPPLQALSAVRPMIGRSGPFLIRASDESLYIVKTSGNSRHPNLLANEFLGSALCMAVGLPVALSRKIELSTGFLEAFNLSTRYGDYLHHPKPGLHYASQLVAPHDDKGFITPAIGPSSKEYVSNKTTFLGMYLLDMCVRHRDQRQTIFVKDSSGPTSRAVFIDHGHMFGGSKWDWESSARISVHPLTGLQGGNLNTKDILSWLEVFSAKLPNALDSALKYIPSEWYTGSLSKLQTWLHHRIDALPSLIDQELEKALIFRKDHNAGLYIQDTGIRQVRN